MQILFTQKKTLKKNNPKMIGVKKFLLLEYNGKIKVNNNKSNELIKPDSTNDVIYIE